MSSGESALPMPSPPTRWSVDELIPFGKYILLNKISMGATAAVYRAKIRGEAGFERLVSVKRILPQMAGDPDFVETFVREAKVCARLTHSNICPIYELGKVGESLYMASEWVAGKDLRLIMARLHAAGRVMPPFAAAWIASRLCDALDYAHSLKDANGERLNLLHQDLSPANIVVSYEGAVKLLDFGLARATGRAQQTNVDALKQKLGYMSPESVLGTPIDRRSDLFGVGVCLYEMVTGKRLFAGNDDVATLKLLRNATVPPASDWRENTPEELETIILRALARDPEARWPSAGEMAHALTTFVAAGDPSYGTRNLAELMQSLFDPDRHAEQSKLNTLLSASQDATLMEQRRRFFSSPLGAAAIARAEATRKHQSNRPPPPNGAFGVAPGARNNAAPAAVTEPSTSATGSGSHISERQTANQTATGGPVPTVLPAPAALKAPAPAGKAAPAGIPNPAAKPAQPDDDALTTYRPPVLETPRPGAFAQNGLAPTAAGYSELIRRSGEDDAEPTLYRPEPLRPAQPSAAGNKAASDAPAPEGRITQPSIDPVGMAELQNEPTIFELDPSMYIEALASDDSDAPPASAKASKKSEPDVDFESEATSFIGAGQAGQAGQSAAARALFEANNSNPSPNPGYEEDATRIFFSSDGQGALDSFELAELPDEDLTMVSPPTALRLGAAGTAAAAKALPTAAAGRQATGAHAPVSAARLAALSTAVAHPSPARLPPTAAAHASARMPTLTISSAPPQSRAALWWTLLAAASVVLVGLLLKTNLGITLGLRQPPSGNILIQTTPATDASIRLDGIYRGRAPLRLQDVPAGVREINLVADGYAPVTRSVTLQGGAELKENISLSPAPSAQ